MAEEPNPVEEPQEEPTLDTSLPDVDKLAPEAPPDESPADDSVEAENKGGETPLHKLLLEMVNDDEEPTGEDGLARLGRMLDDGAQVDAKNADGETALHLAAANGLVEAATRLIKAGANVSEPDNEMRQPLHKACSGGRTILVELLLEFGADINAKQHKNATPLHEACWPGHLGVVKLLLEKVADTQVADEDGWSPLHAASQSGHTEIIQALLAKDKTNIDATEALDNQTAMHLAIYNGYVDAVSVLLEHGASVGIRDRDNWTPLMTATKQKDKEMVEKLLGQKGALELETRDKFGHTPLLKASINGFSAGAKLLIGAGAACNVQSTRTKSTPLISASSWGYSGIVKALLEVGDRTIINSQDEDGWAAIHFASIVGHSNVVGLLLQHQADATLATKNGQTPLHLASKRGNENVVKRLLKAKATVDVRDPTDQTALHLASGAGPEDYSEQCESEDEDDETGCEDLSPEEREMMEFRSGRHAAVVKLLLGSGAKPDAKTTSGETALHLAAARGDPARIEPILEHMNDRGISTEDDLGRTALFMACTGDNPESAVKCLLKSDKLRVAHLFGTSGGEDDDIEWAANDPKTHEVAKWLMKERLKRKEMAQPAGSDKWSVVKWAAYSQLPEVLSRLITKSPPPPDVKAALGLVLDVALASALGTRANQESGHSQLLQVLSQLIDTVSGTPEIQGTLKSTLELVKRAKGQAQDLKLALILSKSSKAEPGASSHKGKKKEPEKTEHGLENTTVQQTAPTTRTTDYLRALVDILRDPPFSQTHIDSRIGKPPKHSPDLSEMLKSLEASIVQFYRGEGESGTFRRYRSLKEVIYDDGPEEIMKKTISDFREILGEFPESLKYLNTEPNFTWVHLPATNMTWMNDMLLRIMCDEKPEGEALPYHELKSFFRDSWTQVPDRTSPSRSMRPRTVVRRQENGAGKAHDDITKEEEEKGENAKKEKNKEEAKKEESGKTKEEAKSEEDRRKKNKHDLGAASATYIPYFCFSTYSEGGEANLSEKQKKFMEMKEVYEHLDDSKSSVIHESPTLDEWYYHFATDEKATNDRERRNKTQIVTKAIEGSKRTRGGVERTEGGDKNTSEDKKEKPTRWTLLRVNQLWAWTIADRWLITATSCLFDGSNGTLVEGILEQLGKEVEAGGSASQPDSAADMCRFVVDYCIGTFERLSKIEEQNPGESKPGDSKPGKSKSQGQWSIRQIFSNTINQIGRDEAVLFEKFRNQTERWREQIPSEAKKPTEEAPPLGDETSPRDSPTSSPQVPSDRTSEQSSQDSTYEHIRKAIKEAEEMYCEIKDIRDELNILTSAAQHQKTVEEGLTGGSLDVNLAAAYIVKDLQEMDNSAERIQSAINTTLSLLQSENANLQAKLSLDQSILSNHLADLARRQGKTLMVFTIVTILFLPLSFLSSLFALDVASFLQAPGWAFAVIFAVSFAFSAVTALVAQRWDKFSPYMRPLRKFILHPWKSIKTGLKSSEEKKVPEPPPEPATGEIDSLHAPSFSSRRRRLRRMKSDPNHLV